MSTSAEDLAGALAARRELGDDAELAIIAGFLDRTGQAIDARVDQRLSVHGLGQNTAANEQRDKTRLTLTVTSIALGIPLTALCLLFGSYQVLLAAIVWAAITAINISFHWKSRR